ncbi:phage integrase (pseudogene) [Streptococcus pneumoniae]|nr:phage integrase (pseudogene) [Streptococcus pneumoniae]VJD87359.1 phage integrase (pseudogene) [Streptococcus pneumoniae]VJG79159.1 phage integrase (pseudogene) [Streptococcus pneumoniae]VJK79715.1 phage integrase (pseudogene) [Streptococcus pneumoniae]VJL52678.1 phage integrase (pseudogene) [Streptococcus pneumoniae]
MKSLGINFYLFLPTHLSTILLRKHGLISKSTSKRYYQVAIPFTRLFCLVLVSIDYINCLSETTDKNWHKSDRVFVTNTGKTVHSSILSKSLQRANERLKKPIPKHLSPHIFRHTTISILSENKIPLKTITDRVGHSDSEVTTSIYTHVTKNMKDEAINVLDKVMKKIFEKVLPLFCPLNTKIALRIKSEGLETLLNQRPNF